MEHCIEIWDEAGVLRRLKKRDDRLRRLVDMYVEKTPERLRRLTQALEDKEYQQLAFVAHEIRGTSGNIGAMRIYTITGEIEALAASDNHDKVSALAAPLSAEYQKLIKILEAYFGETLLCD